MLLAESCLVLPKLCLVILRLEHLACLFGLYSLCLQLFLSLRRRSEIQRRRVYVEETWIVRRKEINL